jgi:hypothetical protein
MQQMRRKDGLSFGNAGAAVNLFNHAVDAVAARWAEDSTADDSFVEKFGVIGIADIEPDVKLSAFLKEEPARSDNNVRSFPVSEIAPKLPG